jgi:hypothetical protein
MTPSGDVKPEVGQSKTDVSQLFRLIGKEDICENRRY